MRTALAPSVVGIPALLALGLAAPPAAAQPADRAKVVAAQALFDQAQAAMDRKDYASACPKLEEVTHLLPNGVGGLLTLARCYEGSGKLASAWSTFVVAQSAAAQAKRPELERQARARVVALKPRLAQLTVTVPDATQRAPGLSITRDGTPLGAAQWGTPVPVDAGRHVVVATATQKQRWEKEVNVAADGTVASVDVGLLADAPVVESPAATPAAGEAPTFWGKPHIAGAAVAGVGLVGVIVGAAFGGVALSKKNQSNDGHCLNDKCDAAGAQLRSDGLTAASVSTGAIVVGGVALAAGVTLLAIPWRKAAATGRAPLPRVRLGVGPGAVDVSAVW